MKSSRFTRALAFVVAAFWLSVATMSAQAADEAVAASGPPLNIALFVNSSTFQCYNDGKVEATRALAERTVARINELGGVRGRPIAIEVYDNEAKGEGDAKAKAKAEVEATKRNVRDALAKENLLALIGLSNESNATAAFDAVVQQTIEQILKTVTAEQKQELLDHVAGLDEARRQRALFNAIVKKYGAIPVVANISVGKTLKAYPNVYSTQPDQEAERVPAMMEFFKADGADTIAFLGRKGADWSKKIGDGIKELAASDSYDMSIVLHRDLEVKDVKLPDGNREPRFKAAELEAAIAALEANPPKMLVVSVGTTATPILLRRLQKSGVQPDIFMIGHLDHNVTSSDAPYPKPIYGFHWAKVPEVENDRVLEVLSKGTDEEWLFAGRKTVSGKEWVNNECSKFFQGYVPATFSGRNIAAVTEGARYADMIKLIATSAAKTGQTLDTGRTHDGFTSIQRYRKAVLEDLGWNYAADRGAFKGIFENWSFDRKDRVRAQTPLIVILPSNGLGRKQLATSQFVRVRDGNLKRVRTIYLDVDLIRMYGVDNNAKSFFAEFYLAMRKSDNTIKNDPADGKAPKSDAIEIQDITFTNAFLDPRAARQGLTNGREITIEELYGGGETDTWPADMRVYKVAGRFRFTPDFSEYPFDKQKFSIDLQPKQSDKSFIIQPPPPELRDKVVASEGWIPDKQYVSIVRDFVPIVDAFTHTPSVVPFFNARYVWQMERETTDYYIRVIVPLMFILIVAYLSIFIPKAHLEAIVTIQVTALLSAVALYLSLPQIDTDTATISDQVFMFDYMMVSLMIIVSILRINARVVANPWINNLLAFVHIVIIPATLLGLVLYISKTELLTGFATLPGWELLGLG